MEYLQAHNLEGVLETIVNDVLSEQPANPLQAMSDRLAAAAAAAGGGAVVTRRPRPPPPPAGVR
jgi:hypothetical protein